MQEDLKDIIIRATKEIILPFLLILTLVVSFSSLVRFIIDFYKLNRTLPTVNNIMIISIGLTSLYVAWRKFVYKKKPHVHVTIEKKDEKLNLKLTNTGKSIVRPRNVKLSRAKTIGNKIHFDNHTIRFFNDDILQQGDKSLSEIGEKGEVLMFKVEELSVGDFQGETHNVETMFKRKPYVDSQNMEAKLKNRDSETQVRIQKFFEEMRGASYGYGTSIGFEDFENKNIEEIVKEKMLDSKKSERTILESIAEKIKKINLSTSRDRI